ncbi:MAG TPA: class II aldolase/adducin family protein [Candidatus Methylacidiphilales bacterium]|nr:class II aldolase/adducin family protein [Candidatus Methylacidiphilales bacterium]
MSEAASEKAAALLKLSHDLGREDRGLAILGEGNASCRLDEETFLVKASGAALAGLDESGLVACRFGALLPLLEAGEMGDAEVEKALLAARVDSSQPKPSVEAVFHAWLLTLPGIEVAGHTHPVAVNQILCAGDDPSRRFALERRFPDEIVCCGTKSVLVPYVDPGIELARAIKNETEKFVLAENRPPRLILLQNHGLIALGGTTGAVLAATLMAEKAARIFTGAGSWGGPVALTAQNVARIDSRPDEHYRQKMLKL